MSAFFVLWSLIWFGIGYTLRKKYLLGKQIECEKYPLVEEAAFDKIYRSHYLSRGAGMLSLVFLTAIFWYLLGGVRQELDKKDCCILLVLAFLCLFSFLFYRLKKLKNNIRGYLLGFGFNFPLP